MSKTIPIVIAFDNNFVAQAAVLIASVCENTNHDVHFYAFVDNVYAFSRRKLNLLTQKYKNLTIDYIDVADKIAGMSAYMYISASTHSRVFATELLPKHIEKVLYLDCDAICVGDIAEFYGEDLHGHIAGVIREYGVSANNQYAEYRKQNNIWENYWNAGMLLLNIKKMRDADVIQKYIGIEAEVRATISTELNNHSLNILFGDDIELLDERYNVMTHALLFYRRTGNTKKIVDLRNTALMRHFEWVPKPWHGIRDETLFFAWWHYARKTPFFAELATTYKMTIIKGI